MIPLQQTLEKIAIEDNRKLIIRNIISLSTLAITLIILNPPLVVVLLGLIPFGAFTLFLVPGRKLTALAFYRSVYSFDLYLLNISTSLFIVGIVILGVSGLLK